MDKNMSYTDRFEVIDPVTGKKVKLRNRLPTEEEKKEFTSCIRNSAFKFGLPMAISVHWISGYVAQKRNKPLASPKQRFGVFAFNWFLSTFLFSPFCGMKMSEKIYENELKYWREQEESGEMTPTQSTLQTDKGTYSGISTLDSSYDGASGSFSHLNLDYTTSMENQTFSDPDVNENLKPKTPEVTYDDLRQQNRNNYRAFQRKPVIVPEPIKEPSVQNAPIEKPRKKNKYGDEME